MVANVIFHQLAHQAVDGTPCRGQALEDVSAGFILIQSAQHALSWPTTFLVRFTKSNFSREVCDIIIDYPMGVWYQGFGRKERP